MAQTQKKQQDMGTGDVKKLLLQLMIPAVVAQVVNLLYNIVDRIYIGHISGIGAAALTGVGLFTPILMLLNAFAMLIGSGGATVSTAVITITVLIFGEITPKSLAKESPESFASFSAPIINFIRNSPSFASLLSYHIFEQSSNRKELAHCNPSGNMVT